MAKKKKQSAENRAAELGTMEETPRTKDEARPKQKKNKKS